MFRINSGFIYLLHKNNNPQGLISCFFYLQQFALMTWCLLRFMMHVWCGEFTAYEKGYLKYIFNPSSLTLKAEMKTFACGNVEVQTTEATQVKKY